MSKSENGAPASSEKDRRLTPIEEIEEAHKAETVTMCCCCVCQCEDKATLRKKCCIIFPLKCGIQFVALTIIVIALCQFLEVFYQLLNDQIDWWYVLVGALLCVPLIVAFAFAVVFFASEGDSERVLLRTALILTLVGVTLSAAWNASYFWFFYKSNEIVTGNDGVGFVKNTKKQEIVFSVYIAAVLDAFFAYFICITTEYIECYREDQVKAWIKENILAADEEAEPIKPVEEEAPKEAPVVAAVPIEKAESEKNEEEPKEEKEEAPAEPEEPAAGDDAPAAGADDAA